MFNIQVYASPKKYSASKTLFDNAIYEIAEDNADELFHSKNSCTNHDCRIGEYCFCEAIIVDLAESEDKRQTNHFQKKKNQLSSTLSSTVCLLCTLIEDLGCAIELHEKIANKVTALHSLDPRNYLFNGQEEGDYLFEQGIINEASSDDKEYIQLYELWCLFAYREFYKNLLVILDEVSLSTFGEKTSISNRFWKLFDLHDDEKIHAYLIKLSNNTHSEFGLTYKTVMNNQSYTIHSWINQPHQFSLGNIPTMSGITDSVGEGWDERKITKKFKERNNIVNGQEEVPMTTSKHFEHAYITLSTMTKIKLTTKKGKGNLFTIECYMPLL
jgi:hypothetical protein